jgi:hypothetical protein
VRFILPLLLAACSGSKSPPPATPDDTGVSADTSDSAPTTPPTSDTTDSVHTGSSPTGETATDTGASCGPDCHFDPDDGICVFPTATRIRSPLTDASIDAYVDSCGPLAVVVCDTGALGFAHWLGSETGTYEVYAPDTREWLASFEEEDGGDISEACGASAYYGDPAQIPCLRELAQWIQGVNGVYLTCDIWDGQTLGGTVGSGAPA